MRRGPGRAAVGLALCAVLLLMLPQGAWGDDILAKKTVCSYQDKEFCEAVADLARQTGVQIFVDTAIKGKITINLGDVTLDQALEGLSAMAGVFYGQIGENAIAIAPGDPKAPLYAQISQTEVVRLNYVTAKQAMDLLAASPYRAVIAGDPVSDRLVVTAPRPILAAVRNLVDAIDQPRAQIVAQAQFLDTSDIKQRDWDSAWQFTKGKTDPDGIVTFQFDGVLLGFRDTREGNILVNLLAAVGTDRFRILSHPHVTVQDGEQAKIFVGDQSYFPITTVFGPSLPQPVQIQPINAGTTLQITPKIVEGGKLLVRLHAEASQVVGSGIQGYPDVNSRTVDTVLTVLDGETIVIGGLAGCLEEALKTRVPVLSDFPIVGNFFRSSHKIHRQEEVTIFLTLTVVKCAPTAPPPGMRTPVPPVLEPGR